MHALVNDMNELIAVVAFPVRQIGAENRNIVM